MSVQEKVIHDIENGRVVCTLTRYYTASANKPALHRGYTWRLLHS